MPFNYEEGPFGLIICPSVRNANFFNRFLELNLSIASMKRELARQTMLTIKYYADATVQEGFPEMRILACIGGDPIKNQIETIKRYND